MTLEGCSVEADIDGFIQAKSTGTEPPGEAQPAGSTAAGASPICPKDAWPPTEPPLLGQDRAAHSSLLGEEDLADPEEGSGTMQAPGWVPCLPQHSEGGVGMGIPLRTSLVPCLIEVREAPSPARRQPWARMGKWGLSLGLWMGTSCSIRWHRSCLPCPRPPWASPACCPQLLCPTRTTMIGRSPRRQAALASSHPAA